MEKAVSDSNCRLSKEKKEQERLNTEIEKYGRMIKEKMSQQETRKDEDESTCRSLNLKTLHPF